MKKRDYRARMAYLRPFVAFDYKQPQRVKPSTKGKITRYYNYLQSIQDEYRAIDPPKGSNFQKVQADINPTFERVPKRIAHTKFKVLFIPKESTASIEYDRKERSYVIAERVPGGKRISKYIPFEDKDALLTDPRGYLKKLLKHYPANTLFRLYNPQDWKSPDRRDKGSIAAFILQYIALYPQDGADYMTGLVAERVKKSA